jgi:prophage tail gpP-like protein
MIIGTNMRGIAQRLTKAYGITARSAVGDIGVLIPSVHILLGETPYQIIESVTRYAGYLVYEDATGALVLDRVGPQSQASGFTLRATSRGHNPCADWHPCYQAAHHSLPRGGNRVRIDPGPFYTGFFLGRC